MFTLTLDYKTFEDIEKTDIYIFNQPGFSNGLWLFHPDEDSSVFYEYINGAYFCTDEPKPCKYSYDQLIKLLNEHNISFENFYIEYTDTLIRFSPSGVATIADLLMFETEEEAILFKLAM
jgi:hypothetical protein